MDAVLDEKYIDVQEVYREKHDYISHDEVVEGVRDLMKKHRESLTALANA